MPNTVDKILLHRAERIFYFMVPIDKKEFRNNDIQRFIARRSRHVPKKQNMEDVFDNIQILLRYCFKNFIK